MYLEHFSGSGNRVADVDGCREFQVHLHKDRARSRHVLGNEGIEDAAREPP